MAYVAIRLTVTLKAPLLITSRQVGFVWESEPFIPGGVLRGALVQILLPHCSLSEAERHAPETAPSAHREECAFHRLFYAEPPPRFSHALPGLESPLGLLPQTAQTCKRHGGFKRDQADDERHGVFDVVIRQALAEDGGKPPVPRCPDCQEKAQPFVGRVYALRGDRYISPRVLPRRLARTAVGRERGAVAEGLLYTLEALGEQMDRDELGTNGEPLLSAQATFHATVWAEETFEAELRQALRRVRSLGAAVSRGMGRVAVEARRETVPIATPERLALAAEALSQRTKLERPSLPLPKETDLIQRLLAFNCLWTEERKSQAEDWHFTVDLQADALLRRADGPTFQLTPDLLDLPDGVRLVRAFATHHQVGGWSTAWGLPKPTAPTVAAGSVFLYDVRGGDVALSRAVLERLVALEREGVGQRREEGYGWLHVCTPFHLEREVRR